MSDAATLAFYDAEASAYAERARATAGTPALDRFAAALPECARVLDFGCGGGQDSAALIARGFRVVSVDASPGLAAEAKRRWNVDVRQQRFLELVDEEAFDGVWACASLHHAAARDLPDVFARMHRALIPGGILHASLKTGEDRRDKFGRFYCAMSAEALAALVADGWRDVKIVTKPGGGYDDEYADWLMLTATRA